MTNLDATKIEFRLRMDPKRKAVKSHKENEAIQFDFDITADDFEEIASEMHKSGLILEEDSRAVAKLLKVQVHTLLKDRKERIAQAQAAAKEKELAKLQKALEEHHQMVYLHQQQSQNLTVENQIIAQQQNQQQMNITTQQQMNMLNQQQITIAQQQPILSQTPQQQQQQQQINMANQMQQSQQHNLIPSSKPPQEIMQNINQPIKLPVQQQQQQVPITNNQLPQQAPSPSIHQQGDSGIGLGTPQSGGTASSSTSIKKRRSNKSSERYPKLVVLSLNEEKIVECQMEVKPNTITFKFDVFDVNPDEVAKDLVRLSTISRLLQFKLLNALNYSILG